MKNLRQSILIFALTVAAAIVTNAFTASESRAGCGLGCHRAMGSCYVHQSLWQAAAHAQQSGYRLTSCCRTPAYNQQLRRCGYPVATNSAHMSGNAVDVKFPPSKCNRRSLAQYGFQNVCPLYHFNHCHIATCGNARTYDNARASARRRAHEVRSKNLRNAYGRGASSRRHHHDRSARGHR